MQNRVDRAARRLRFGACNQSAGPSGKSVPFSWSTMMISMFGFFTPLIRPWLPALRVPIFQQGANGGFCIPKVQATAITSVSDLSITTSILPLPHPCKFNQFRGSALELFTCRFLRQRYARDAPKSELHGHLLVRLTLLGRARIDACRIHIAAGCIGFGKTLNVCAELL